MNWDGIDRRTFLQWTAMGAAGLACRPAMGQAARPAFPGHDPSWATAWDAALTVLAGNIHQPPKFGKPVLFEGAVYPGIWQECGPHESLVYATLREYVAMGDGPGPIEVARASHMAFFALQREDGQIPSSIKGSGEVGFGQIQMVVPIAATAWELAQILKEEEFLAGAYLACSRWDSWLRAYRNTRATGLVEGFCTYDTGMDNSPRWAGIPNRCPDSDARKCPPLASMPRLCPDLSATVYGARVALAAMARALGKKHEASQWEHDAETIRRLILEKLYSPEDACFYDLDAQGKYVKVRSDVNLRVLNEHVLRLDQKSDRTIFNDMWARQLHNPMAFWAPFPFPSSAMDDPTFVRPIPRNSWGGAAQALTALRVPRWMAHYGKQADAAHFKHAVMSLVPGRAGN